MGNTRGTAAQKRAVAGLLLQAAGNIIEFWNEREESAYTDIDPADARRWLNTWLRGLPGDEWDTRLGPVD